MTPRRVLRVSNNLEVGGGQRLLVQFARHRDRDRIELHVAAFAGGPLVAELAAAGIAPVILPRRGKYDVTLALRLHALIRDRGIEVVHAQLFAARFWARLAARWAGVPCIVSEHALHPRTARGLYPFLERRLVGSTAAWLTDTAARRDEVIESYGAPPNRVRVVPPTYEPERVTASATRDECRRRLGLPAAYLLTPSPALDAGEGRGEGAAPTGCPLIPAFSPDGGDGERQIAVSSYPAAGVVGLCLGRLAPQKGYDLLLAELDRTLTGRGFQLVISGDGPDRELLRVIASARGIAGAVRIVGADVPVAELLAAADLLLLPSRWEGLPLAVLEAAGVGLPILAADLPGLREFAAGYPNLTLVPAGRPGAWRDAISSFLDAPNLRGLPLIGYRAVDGVRELERIYNGLAEVADARG